MFLNRIKYLACLLPHYGVANAIYVEGWRTWDSLVYLLILVPLIELVVKDNKSNLDQESSTRLLNDRWFDNLAYFIVFANWGLLLYWLHFISVNDLDNITLWGNIISFGILNGTVGINVAHELIHRNKRHEQFLGKALLLTSSYMHFFIEHIKGHHKTVGTEEDATSARYNENLYYYWMRAFFMSYKVAWDLEKKRLKNENPFTLNNELVRFFVIHFAFMIAVYFVFGIIPLLAYLGSSLIGILLLEAVTYIQHYGLDRDFDKERNRFEKVSHHHTWDCSYTLGRIILFEMPRHSDHHLVASKKYQLLDHQDRSPQMPTGYPGMIVLALIPPLWFKIMNPRIQKYAAQKE